MASQPTHADSVLARYQAIGHRAEDEGNRMLRADRPKDAIRVLTDAQRDLRDLKREVVEAERQIRLEATAARQRITSQSQASAIFGKTVKRAVSQGAAAQKTSISQNQTRALAAYLPVKSAIDQLIADLARMKEEIRHAGNDSTQDESDGIPDPPITDIPAQWAADPSQRHEMRWWDGFRWTEHVSDRGERSKDPLL